MNDLIDRLRGADPTLGRQLPVVTLEAVRERASAPLLVQAESRPHTRRALAVVGVLCVLSALGLLLARRVDGPSTGSSPRELYAVFMTPEATGAQVKAVADVLRTAGIPYRYVGKEEALAELRQLYANEPAVAEEAAAANMPTSFRLREADVAAEEYGAALTAIARLPGFAGLSGDVNGPPPTDAP